MKKKIQKIHGREQIWTRTGQRGKRARPKVGLNSRILGLSLE